MILPKTEYALLDYADKCGVSQSLILKFIEEGGAEYFQAVLTEYIAEELVKKDFLDGLTPVGGVAFCRDTMAAVFNNFKAEFDTKNKQLLD